MGVGYAFRHYAVPTEQEMKERLNYKRVSDDEKRRAQQMLQMILENAKSDRPAWDVAGLQKLAAEKEKANKET
ncbi:hypothetical protein HDU76_000156 [Blyttiomyces sp. JEL0837]|nr:hypothetical protein HDU76_000156 [Blyttiomyces sp. JEL0837]